MAKRRVLYSFHYERDVWRAAQVRNMGVVEGNEPLSENDWEEVKRKGEKDIKRWIDEQLSYRSCVVVLVGKETSTRKWVKYEIERGWELGKGVVGICIHNLKDHNGKQDVKGSNPFWGTGLSSIVKLYDPPYQTSTYVYNHIKDNISDWVEEDIKIRNQHSDNEG